MTTEDYGEMYTRMHDDKPKLFAGNSIKSYIDDIAGLVAVTEAKKLADYGSGKGYQYLAMRVHEAWGVLPHCYDVGVRQLSSPLPVRSFHGVICTDVMEHISERDIQSVLDDIFLLLEVGRSSFAFFAIACRLAKKELPDGRNAHLTVRPPEWWEGKLAEYQRDGLIISVRYDL